MRLRLTLEITRSKPAGKSDPDPRESDVYASHERYEEPDYEPAEFDRAPRPARTKQRIGFRA